MGEVRKRKASAEGESAKAPENVVVQKQGMGFFSVVFVAAILAGSGCHVLKKDQAVEFDAVRGLAAQLKADNVKTLATIASMQEGVEQKDTIIKRLQEEVTATHEKNALFRNQLKKAGERALQVRDGLMRTNRIKFDKDLPQRRQYLTMLIETITERQERGDGIKKKLEEKLSDLQETVRKSSDENGARSKTIAELQSELNLAKTETASKLIQLHELVSTSGVDVEKIDGQAAQISKVMETLAALEIKLNEESSKIVELGKKDVSSDISALESSIQAQKTAVENLMGALANAAKAEDVAKIAALTKEIQQAIVDVEESKVSKNAVGPLRNEFETAIKELQKAVMDVAQSVKESDATWKSELTEFSESFFKSLEVVQKIQQDSKAQLADQN